MAQRLRREFNRTGLAFACCCANRGSAAEVLYPGGTIGRATTPTAGFC
jgi:hypothetical protein